MHLIRNEYPIEVIQLTVLLHITDRIRDARLSAKIQTIRHLSNEAMWTEPEDLPYVWKQVELLHESHMSAQLTAQTQRLGIWSSPGVTTFSPHHPQFTETSMVQLLLELPTHHLLPAQGIH